VGGRLRTRPSLRRVAAAVVVASAVCSALAPPAGAAPRWVERLAGGGPATFLVGTMFTLGSVPTLWWRAVSGDPVALPSCRLAHGTKMMLAGAVLLPASLLAAPFAPRRFAEGPIDGMVDAYQEDYCTRPLASVYP
jgi:hypothetical protein